MIEIAIVSSSFRQLGIGKSLSLFAAEQKVKTRGDRVVTSNFELMQQTLIQRIVFLCLFLDLFFQLLVDGYKNVVEDYWSPAIQTLSAL